MPLQATDVLPRDGDVFYFWRWFWIFKFSDYRLSWKSVFVFSWMASKSLCWGDSPGGQGGKGSFAVWLLTPTSEPLVGSETKYDLCVPEQRTHLCLWRWKTFHRVNPVKGFLPLVGLASSHHTEMTKFKTSWQQSQLADFLNPAPPPQKSRQVFGCFTLAKLVLGKCCRCSSM